MGDNCLKKYEQTCTFTNEGDDNWAHEGEAQIRI